MPFLPAAPPKVSSKIWCDDCKVAWDELIEGSACWCCGKDQRPPRVHAERG